MTDLTEENLANAVSEWRREGCVLLPGFLSSADIAPLAADFEQVFGTPAEHFAVQKQAKKQARKQEVPAQNDSPPAFSLEQFKNFENLPFACSPALNLIALHPKLIAFAQAALETNHLSLYQGQAWAKYTGEANYEQPYHCDFNNHTLTVPSLDPKHNSITFIILVSDVTEAQGPTHYVPKSKSAAIAGFEEAITNPAGLTEILLPHSKSTAAPAGSLFAYGTDVFHRGTNLTAPEGYRYVVTSCFKRADNPQIGYTAWPYHDRKPWQNLLPYGTPQQLHCLGIPLPGDSYWTEETLRLTALRWPQWDLSPWKT